MKCNACPENVVEGVHCETRNKADSCLDKLNVGVLISFYRRAPLRILTEIGSTSPVISDLISN